MNANQKTEIANDASIKRNIKSIYANNKNIDGELKTQSQDNVDRIDAISQLKKS